jgi:hypothetical protein
MWRNQEVEYLSSGVVADHLPPAGADVGIVRRLLGRPLAEWEALPAAWRECAVALLGALAAAVVGGRTAGNPRASPAGAPVLLRVLVIIALIAAGLYAQTSRIQMRMGTLLIGAGLFSSLWLLNGSGNRLLFSIGVICSAVAPTVFAFLMLTHPTGHLRSRVEQQFLRITGGALAVLWWLGVAIAQQPPLSTSLLQCTPHCSPDAFSLGSATNAVGVVKVAMVVAWLALALGTPILLARRARSAPVPVRRSLVPLLLIAGANAFMLLGCFVSDAAGLHAARAFGALYAGCAAVIPLCILEGLRRERLFMGQMLAEFVNVEAVGGTLSVISRSGLGTTVRGWVPGPAPA